MDGPLYYFLPPLLRPSESVLLAADDGYPLWLETMYAVDESMERCVNEYYRLGFDARMNPKPLTQSNCDHITSLMREHENVCSHFDRAVHAKSMNAPTLRDSAEKRRPLLEWWLGGRLCTIARAKCLEGRCHVFRGDFESARRCALELRSAGLLFLQSGQPDLYMGGLEYCRYSLLLLHELAGFDSGSPVHAREALEFSLSSCRIEWFVRAFFAPQAQWAIECLEKLSRGDSLEQTLRLLAFAFREAADGEGCGYDGAFAESTELSSILKTLDRPSERREMLDVGKTAAIIGMVSNRCIVAFNSPLCVAHEKFASLASSCLPGAYIRDNTLDVQRVAASHNSQMERENVIGLLFAGRFALGMAKRAKANEFLWYQTAPGQTKEQTNVSGRKRQEFRGHMT